MSEEENKLKTTLAREIGRRIRQAHHVPGRIRLKFDPSLAKHPQRESLSQWVPDVRSFELLQVNRWSKSALLGYDATRISPELIEELFSTTDLQRKKDILQQIKQLAFQ